MKSKQSILIPFIAALIFIFGTISANAGGAGLISSLKLTTDQINKLGTIIVEFNTSEIEIESKLDNTFFELKQELKRGDRFDSESKIRAGAKHVNKLIKNISSLHGDMLKVKMEYLLKAKNIFTDQQRIMIFNNLLNFDMDIPDDSSLYLEMDITSFGLDLTNEQIKKILKYQKDMEIKKIKLKLKIKYKLLDLQEELLSDNRDPKNKKVNKIILAIIDIGTKLIDNRVNYTLKAKDVLTLKQKKEVFHMMLLKS